MTVTRLYPLPVALTEARFPIAMTTIYSGRSRGTYDWLTRRGPDGLIGKILWIDVGRFNEYARKRGMPYQLPEDEYVVRVKEGWQH
jgi:hypothetical protein